MAEIIKIKDITSDYLVNKIKSGAVFIYPTDTIYGLGCNAKNPAAVRRIREIKQRFDKPFSVIAPSKAWITKYFHIKKSYVAKLPGPFTYVVLPKKHTLVCDDVAFGETLGIRIPNHPFTLLIQKAKLPFVTTSVNVTGKKPYVNVKQIPQKILKEVDVIIDAGVLDNTPSTVIDFTGELPKLLR